MRTTCRVRDFAHIFENYKEYTPGATSAAISCPILFLLREKLGGGAGSFPEQRLEIKPKHTLAL